jgi:hypothetical protein
MLAVASRCAQRLPHLNVHGVAQIDAENQSSATEVSGSKWAQYAGVVPQEAEREALR